MPDSPLRLSPVSPLFFRLSASQMRGQLQLYATQACTVYQLSFQLTAELPRLDQPSWTRRYAHRTLLTNLALAPDQPHPLRFALRLPPRPAQDLLGPAQDHMRYLSATYSLTVEAHTAEGALITAVFPVTVEP